MYVPIVLSFSAVALIVAGALWLRQRTQGRRSGALRELLDSADALEAQLHDYKTRMQGLRSLLTRLPSDMTAPAIASIDPEAQVQMALREVLAHRLWIKRESGSATQAALDAAVAALRKSRGQLEQQLSLLDQVAGELESAGTALRAAYREAAAAQRSASDAPRPDTDPPPRLH
jgi:DNA repair exonuclease SbcCD ATPase subunit